MSATSFKLNPHRQLSIVLAAALCLTLNMLAAIASADPPATVAAEELQPVWSGSLSVGGTELPLVFRLAQKDGQTLVKFRSPKQSSLDFPATIEIKEKKLILAVPSLQSRFEGTLSEDGAAASGHWLQGGKKLPLVMKRSLQRPEIPKRPQHPKPPFPYKTEEVVFENTKAAVRLAATLSLPNAKGPAPAVILISGSGQQDRDETIFDHKPFLVIADHLTRAGFAVLRYDDRGVGASAGADKLSEATSADFAEDTVAAYDFLSKRPDIDPKRIALLGHSEGGIIAPMVASQRPVAALVHLAGPTLPGSEILRYQFRHSLRELPARQLKLAETFLNKLVVSLASTEVGKAEPKLLRKLFDDHAAALPESDREAFLELREVISKTGQIAVVPWTHYFIKYDPAPALKNLKCPLLALFGEKDVQVLAKDNAACLRSLPPAGDSVEIHEFPGLNHLFQPATTGEGNEYPDIEQTIAPEVLSVVTDFLKAKLVGK